jgi:hypothetical protein
MKDQIKKTFKRFFEDKKTSLQTKALARANDLTKPRLGTPHDWGDWEKYVKEHNLKGDSK